MYEHKKTFIFIIIIIFVGLGHDDHPNERDLKLVLTSWSTRTNAEDPWASYRGILKSGLPSSHSSGLNNLCTDVNQTFMCNSAS